LQKADVGLSESKENVMADFMLLIKGGDPVRPLSPEEMQQNMQKWGAWMKRLAEAGHLKGGAPLEKGGKIVMGPKGVVTDGPFPEVKDLIGGYLVLQAKDADEAAMMAQGCPIFDETQHQNPKTIASLEIRALGKMEM
jgi:hypothetical protein